MKSNTSYKLILLCWLTIVCCTILKLFGCHFNDWLLECATSKMINEDGTTGPHYNIDQSNTIARQYNVIFDHFNEWDWNYVLNMVYSDYYGSVTNENSSYVKLAKKFIEDKDAPKGKALHYYLAMKS